MIWALVAVSAIYGRVATLAFRWFADRAKVRRTVNRIVAHLMELSLFFDSPALVLRAQWGLLGENLRLLRLLVPSLVVSLAVFIALFPQLDAAFGHTPLPVGESTVLTAESSGAPGWSPQLDAPAGIVVETPAVTDVHDREVNWRVRPIGRISGELRLRYSDGRVLTRRIVAGPGLIYGWTLPFAKPSIEIRYPRISLGGMSWMVWFFLISSAVAIGYRR